MAVSTRAHYNNNDSSGGGHTSVTVTMTTAVLAGDCLSADINYSIITTDPGATVSDNINGAWVSQGSLSPAGFGGTITLWTLANSKAAAASAMIVTISWGAVTINFQSIEIYDDTGADTVTPIDIVKFNNGNSALCTTAAQNSNRGGEIGHSGSYCANDATSAAAPWTGDTGANPDANGFLAASQTIASSGTSISGKTNCNSGAWAMTMWTVQPPASGTVWEDPGLFAPEPPDVPPMVQASFDEPFVFPILSEDGYVCPLQPPDPPPTITYIEEQFVAIILSEDGYTVPPLPPDIPVEIVYTDEPATFSGATEEAGYVMPLLPPDVSYTPSGVDEAFAAPTGIGDETGYVAPLLPPDIPVYAPPVEEQFAAPTGIGDETGYVVPPVPDVPPYSPPVEEQFAAPTGIGDETGYVAPPVPDVPPYVPPIEEQFAASTGIGDETGYTVPPVPDVPPYTPPVEEQFVGIVLTEDPAPFPVQPELPPPVPPPASEGEFITIILTEDGYTVPVMPDVPPFVAPGLGEDLGVSAVPDEGPGPIPVQPEYIAWVAAPVPEEIPVIPAIAFEETGYVIPPLPPEVIWVPPYVQEDGVFFIPPPPPIPYNLLLTLGGADVSAYLSPAEYALYASGLLWELDGTDDGGPPDPFVQSVADIRQGRWASANVKVEDILDQFKLPRPPAPIVRVGQESSSLVPTLTSGKSEADYVIVPVGRYGSSVRTAAAGRIDFIVDPSRGGLCATVHGDDGNRYVHVGLSASEGDAGRWVRAGEVIGKVGMLKGVTDPSVVASITATAQKDITYRYDFDKLLVGTAVSFVFLVLGQPEVAAVTFVGALLYARGGTKGAGV